MGEMEERDGAAIDTNVRRVSGCRSLGELTLLANTSPEASLSRVSMDALVAET